MLLFANGWCIEENYRTSLHHLRDVKVLYILCITTKCVKSQQNYFFKKGTKKRRVYAPKEGRFFFRKELLHKIVLIRQYVMKSQQNYFCTKKDKKLIFLTFPWYQKITLTVRMDI